jgi:ribosomal protein S18 acetylase RimI-like enzyme
MGEVMMVGRLIIEPMPEGLLLWRCLHGGPLSARNIDDPQPNPQVDWSRTRARNVPLLKKLIEVYGTCAMVARDGDEIVAALRFYPKALCSFSDGGAGFCLQQDFPAGPADELAARDFPLPQVLPDGSLFVHCLMIASAEDEPDRYKRKGLATHMVHELIRWAKERGWQAIEANAYEDIPILYAISGVAGQRFWGRLGFRVIRQDMEPGINGGLLETVRKDAVAAGIPAAHAANRYRMRYELGPDRKGGDSGGTLGLPSVAEV